MPQAHPYQNYQTAEVQTADQRRLIIMLYDGAIRFLKKADAKIEAKDFEAAHNYLVRSWEIVAELLASLRPEIAGQVGTNLKRLYVYVFNRLVEANLLKDQAGYGRFRSGGMFPDESRCDKNPDSWRLRKFRRAPGDITVQAIRRSPADRRPLHQ